MIRVITTYCWYATTHVHIFGVSNIHKFRQYMQLHILPHMSPAECNSKGRQNEYKCHSHWSLHRLCYVRGCISFLHHPPHDRREISCTRWSMIIHILEFRRSCTILGLGLTRRCDFSQSSVVAADAHHRGRFVVFSLRSRVHLRHCNIRVVPRRHIAHYRGQSVTVTTT